MIRYPEWLKKGDTIAVIAPSEGVSDEPSIARFENAKKKLEEKGFRVVFGDCVFKDDGHGRSADKLARAKELNDFLKNEDVKYIIAAKGGEFLCEILPYIDYDVFRKRPVWFQGYSDNTGIAFSTTTLTDTATVYAHNFGDFGMAHWHRAISESLEILEGVRKEQESFDMYQSGFVDKVTGLEEYALDTKVEYEAYMGDKTFMSGRLIGGCFDVIVDLAGTKYEDFCGFADRYKEDGIILYLESFNANTELTTRWLWKLEQLGWFKKVSGVIFGRPMFPSSDTGVTYEAVIKEFMKDKKLPYILGFDLGHKAPQMTFINGAKARIEVSESKTCGKLVYFD